MFLFTSLRFWVTLTIYSFGSSLSAHCAPARCLAGIIGLSQGRIQERHPMAFINSIRFLMISKDRSGGDFTLYDFFDNIFAFDELHPELLERQSLAVRWNLEYSLGFDPFKLFDGSKNGGGASS